MKKNIAMKTGVVLLAAVLLFSVGFIGVTLAKYFSHSSASPNGGHAAGFGTVSVQEHKWELKNGVYEKSDELTTGNTYKVLPGLDIPKDPYVTVKGTFEVTYALYVRVIESDKFPSSVIQYELTEYWKHDEKRYPNDDTVYMYTGVIKADGETPIQILKDDKLYVLQGYDGEEFSLTFSAWLEQIN